MTELVGETIRVVEKPECVHVAIGSPLPPGTLTHDGGSPIYTGVFQGTSDGVITLAPLDSWPKTYRVSDYLVRNRELTPCDMRYVCLVLVATLCLSCRTPAPNRDCFPTDDGFLRRFDGRKFVFDPERMESARHQPECQPAENDPDGHWGLPTEGFQISIRLPQSAFLVDDPIPVEMYVRNISRRELQYVVLVPDKNLKIEIHRAGERLLSRDESRRDDSFASRVRDAVKKFWMPLLFAGTQHHFSLNLTDSYDMALPGRYSVRVGRLVPIGKLGGDERWCMSDWAEFEIKR